MDRITTRLAVAGADDTITTSRQPTRTRIRNRTSRRRADLTRLAPRRQKRGRMKRLTV